MEALIEFLRLFHPITDDEASGITTYFRPRAIKEGEYLFRSGNVCRKLYFVVSGVLRIVATNDKGVDVTYYFIGERQLCTLLQSFNQGTTAADSIQACCDTHVLTIGKQDLLEVYTNFPFMVDAVSQANQQRMLEKIRLKNAYAGQDAVERYRVFINEQPEIANRVPQSYIASYLNITPQSLSRIRRNVP
ncbi:Crp/Fnr family transcriptional regulator [Foetidibacter luteolus]|uniref:Crp/Fnr family transcriptional regulator n=1 Tax=Foetidibacter luteolus TaxID=2608880 RepID=UPI00129C0811|nr:Crp/Fnr family transcriptional regulator [Foetidibacter luteolus]